MKHRNPLSWYDVLTPTGLSGGYGLEPPEETWDWLCVQAYTKEEAKSLAVKRWRKNPKSYINADPGENPFKGLIVTVNEEEYLRTDKDLDPEFYLPYNP